MTKYLKNALAVCLVALSVSLFAQTDIRTAMQTDNWKEVVSLYEKSTKANPTDLEGFLRLGSAYQALGDMAKAKATYAAAAAVDPKSKLINVLEVRNAIMSGDAAGIDKAVKKADKAARGKDADLLRLLGESFLYGPKKNLPEAEKWLKDAYTAKSKDIEILMQLAYTYKTMTGKLGDAVSHYEFASNLNAIDPLPYYMSAKAYWTGNNPDKYIEYLNKALAADPNYVPALRDLADFHYFKRKYEDAQGSYEKLIKAQGDHVNIEDEMQYTNTLFYLKKYDETVGQVNKIIGKDGSKNYLRRLLGYTYFEKGETDKGLEVMQDYFKKVSADKVISRDYEYYGKMLAAKGQDSMALVNLTKAVEMDSSEWPVYGEIGKIKYKNKDYGGAADAFQIRLDSLGEDATATDVYYLGLANYLAYANGAVVKTAADNQRLAMAEKAFTALTKRSPDFATGWLYLAKTQAKSDPDVEADPTKAMEFGKAEVAFSRYTELANAETDAAKKSATKNDRIAALQYLAYMHVTKGNKEMGCSKLNEILGIDPTNQDAIDFKLSIGCP